jgi:putative membrane protein
MMGYGSGMGWMWVFWLLMIIGVVILAVVLARVVGTGGLSGGRTTGPRAGMSGRSRAREILDERYARGELNTEEYQDRLRGLGEDR